MYIIFVSTLKTTYLVILSLADQNQVSQMIIWHFLGYNISIDTVTVRTTRYLIANYRQGRKAIGQSIGHLGIASPVTTPVTSAIKARDN